MAASRRELAIKAVLKARDALSGPVRRASQAVRRTLTPALGAARSAASGLVGVVGRLSSGLSLLGVGGIAVSGAGILKLASDHAKALDELGKFARQVNVNVEALGELEFAAARQGIAQSDLRASFLALNTRLGQARGGFGKLAGFLKTLPLAFRAQVTAAKSTEEAFDLVIRAMARIEDPARRAAFATRFFGEAAGPKLGRLAEAGADGIAALRQEAHKYGVATKDQTDAAEAFVDTQENTNRTIAGLKMQIGAALLPVLKPLLERLTNWILANKELLAQRVAEWVADLITWIQAVDWSAIIDGARDVWATVRDVFGVLDTYVQKIGGWGNALLLLFGVKLVAALGGLPALVIAGTAAAVYELTRLWGELERFDEWRRDQERSARESGYEQRRQVRKALNARVTDGDVTAADVRTAASVGLVYRDGIFRRAELTDAPLRIAQAAVPEAVVQEIKSNAVVEIKIKNESTSPIRTTTDATGPMQVRTTTTAPTGRRGVGGPVGAGVAP